MKFQVKYRKIKMFKRLIIIIYKYKYGKKTFQKK